MLNIIIIYNLTKMFSKTFSKNLDVQHLILLFFSYQQLLLLQEKTQQEQHAVHHTSGITKLIMANFNALILLFSANKKTFENKQIIITAEILGMLEISWMLCWIRWESLFLTTIIVFCMSGQVDKHCLFIPVGKRETNILKKKKSRLQWHAKVWEPLVESVKMWIILTK